MTSIQGEHMPMSRAHSDSQPSVESHKEGPIAKAIEKQTAKLPSDLFLWSALAAIGVSARLQMTGRQKLSNFIGEWVPTLLLLGVYNKIVKVAGSDRTETRGDSAMTAFH